jgi:hypothetical protein
MCLPLGGLNEGSVCVSGSGKGVFLVRGHLGLWAWLGLPLLFLFLILKYFLSFLFKRDFQKRTRLLSQVDTTWECMSMFYWTYCIACIIENFEN